ncbi:MAG: nitroreductase family protein [Cyclobacteriaceae bacterium]
MKKLIDGFEHIRYYPLSFTDQEISERAQSFYQLLDKRRSIRSFSDKPVEKQVITSIIKTAATAPSGANKQPWSFCAVSNPDIKIAIRVAAEEEEKKNYTQRMSETWLKDLEPFATNWQKPFLETAPWLIVVFKKTYELDDSRQQHKNYYVNESVGIACGILITAIHNAGLVTLTHTPSPMNFLARILERPTNEKPFLLLPVGFPDQDTYVPNIKRKSEKEILNYYE